MIDCLSMAAGGGRCEGIFFSWYVLFAKTFLFWVGYSGSKTGIITSTIIMAAWYLDKDEEQALIARFMRHHGREKGKGVLH